MKVRLLLTVAGAAISFAVPALRAEDTMKTVRPEEMVWQDDTTFKGLQYVNLLGDPSKAELVVSRVKLPPNFKIPLHTHPWSEVLTIMSGALGNASSDTDKGEVLKAGSVLFMPANHPHRIWTTEEETVFEFFYTGLFEMTFVNPADDPRKKKTE
jgi:quercetin dioxygenase-like cupin family protein